MHVLMISRPTLYSSVGGDTIQIQNTARYLRELGVQVAIRLADEEIDYRPYDLIHFFNIIRPADILFHINESRLPFVVSTIYVDYSEYEKVNRRGFPGLAFRFLSADRIEYLKCMARHVLNGERIRTADYVLRGHRNSIRHIARRAACLLPNSVSEYRRLQRDYAVNTAYEPIPNAVDASLFNSDIQANTDYQDHITCVARVEGRKNQLNVVRAVLETDLPLSIIGKSSPNHAAYYDECRRLATGVDRIRFVTHLDQHQLAPIYKASRVHVLASWFETTGLSTMEAALLGCNIVITDKGDTRDYFKDFAFYCQPDDIRSIRNSLTEAYETPYNPELKKLILENYTWEITAEKTLWAYKKSLAYATTTNVLFA